MTSSKFCPERIDVYMVSMFIPNFIKIEICLMAKVLLRKTLYKTYGIFPISSKGCCPCVSVNCTEQRESPRHHMVTIKCQEQGLAVAKIASGLTLSESDCPWSAVSPLIATLYKVYGTLDNIKKIIINHSNARLAWNLECTLFSTFSNCLPNFRRIDQWLICVLKFGIWWRHDDVTSF